MKPGNQRKVLWTVACLLVILLAAFSALRGVDFGYHWDEVHTVSLVRKYVREESFLPSWYEWPPVLSYTAYMATVPYEIPVLLAGYPHYYVRDYVQDQVGNNPTFLLNARKVLIAFTYLTPLWLFLAVWFMEKKGGQAFLAAAVLAGSWELNYHSRWVSPDALMMQFGALALLFSVLAVTVKRRSLVWLVLAAAAGAVAAGTKYPGALVLLAPAVSAVYLAWRERLGLWRLIAMLALVGGVGIVVFIAVVPGTFLESDLFWGTIRSQVGHYGGGHGRQTVSPGFSHLGLMLEYLGAVFFSHYPAIALSLSATGLLGAYAYVKEKSWHWLALTLLFPIAYIGLFSRQSVMFVRNLLVVTPFPAILVAKGANFIYENLKPRGARRAWGALLALMIVVNAGFLVFASQTILDRGTDRFKQEFLSYAESHPDDRIFVSEAVFRDLSELDSPMPQNLTRQWEQATEYVAVYYYEAMDLPGYWWVNWIGAAPQSFGPLEVNLDYYAYWQGDDRILLASVEKAKRLEFKSQFLPPAPSEP